MTKLSKILGPDGRPLPRPPQQPARPRAHPSARYDAAQTTQDNKRHWAAADALSARAANNLGVRRLLRNRSRYERENNGYCGGLVLTLANDLFGTGPRLQVQLEDDTAARYIEARWNEWCEAADFYATLHTAKLGKTGDGEAFALLLTGQVGEEPVQLDVVGMECDQCTTPTNLQPKNLAQWVDGIELDARGKPLWYHILKEHPGDNFNTSILFAEYERLPARQVLHWFRKTRAGQQRGIPEITAGLSLCAQMRRWTLATLSAAEAAADMAILLTTEAPADDETDLGDNPNTATGLPDGMDTIQFQRGMMTMLPYGTDAKQMATEHPNQEYGPFKGELLNEFGRPVHAPRNIVTGSSAEYNYSSARMDYLLYRSAMRVERQGCERVMLNPTFRAWYAEARLIPGYLNPNGEELPERLPVAWYWPGYEAIDPLKESLADTERLSNGTTTLQELLAEYGQDWQVFLRQRAREMALMKELGLPLPGWMDPAAGKTAPAGAAQANDTASTPPQRGEQYSRQQLIRMAMDLDGEMNGAYLNGHAG